MKIALDAMGGDDGPAPAIEGSLQAVKELDVEVILVGDETTLKQRMSPSRLHGLPPVYSACVASR